MLLLTHQFHSAIETIFSKNKTTKSSFIFIFNFIFHGLRHRKIPRSDSNLFDPKKYIKRGMTQQTGLGFLRHAIARCIDKYISSYSYFTSIQNFDRPQILQSKCLNKQPGFSKNKYTSETNISINTPSNSPVRCVTGFSRLHVSPRRRLLRSFPWFGWVDKNYPSIKELGIHSLPCFLSFFHCIISYKTKPP